MSKCDRFNCLAPAQKRSDENGTFGTYCDQHWHELEAAIREIREQPSAEFCGECTECGWTGPPVDTIEEAMRDADAHQCPRALSSPEGSK